MVKIFGKKCIGRYVTGFGKIKHAKRFLSGHKKYQMIFLFRNTDKSKNKSCSITNYKYNYKYNTKYMPNHFLISFS